LNVALGVVLLGLTLYVSSLAYTLRSYSRSRLGSRLRNGARQRWLEWLDEQEWNLQTAVGLLRLAGNLGLLVVLWIWYRRDLGRPFDLWTGAEVVVIAVILQSVFAIAIPHALHVHAGEAILSRSLTLLVLIRGAFYPFSRLCDGVEFIIRRLLGKADYTQDEDTERAEQEILDAVSEGEAHGAVDEDQRDMIESVFELDETPVSAIMTPRTDINAVPQDATYDDVRQAILEYGHSRIPVFENTVDHIIGVVYAKDLLKLNPSEPFNLRQIMRTVPYVPESKTLDELLAEFQTKKVQIAIVLDEYGGTAGLATIEDILEELVGEIDDEYDYKPPPAIIHIDDDTLEVDARVHVSEINEELEIEIPDEEDYETIGGFVFATLGKIPTVGEEFQHENVHVKIVSAEARKINRVRIHVHRETQKSA
jgi:putative hemolysin